MKTIEISNPFHKVYMTDNEDGSGKVHGVAIDGTEFSYDVSSDGIGMYLSGELIQYCFPELDVWEREIIITGYTKEMWEEMESKMEEE